MTHKEYKHMVDSAVSSSICDFSQLVTRGTCNPLLMDYSALMITQRGFISAIFDADNKTFRSQTHCVYAFVYLLARLSRCCTPMAAMRYVYGNNRTVLRSYLQKSKLYDKFVSFPQLWATFDAQEAITSVVFEILYSIHGVPVLGISQIVASALEDEHAVFYSFSKEVRLSIINDLFVATKACEGSY